MMAGEERPSEIPTRTRLFNDHISRGEPQITAGFIPGSKRQAHSCMDDVENIEAVKGMIRTATRRRGRTMNRPLSAIMFCLVVLSGFTEPSAAQPLSPKSAQPNLIQGPAAMERAGCPKGQDIITRNGTLICPGGPASQPGSSPADLPIKMLTCSREAATRAHNVAQAICQAKRA